jgi:outer membrane receptor for ferrienterochelin and colicin
MRIALLSAIVLCSAAVASAQDKLATDLSLDSLLNTHISAASKYAQTAAQAPASVTILSSDDLRNGSFRDLQDVLESVRGFYSSDDQNYPYLGTRGFGRSGNLNNRLLVLVDGHTLNEPIWGSTPIGRDLPLSLEAIDRIEIVRGPGATVYGSNAMFGVINIVTRRGQDIDGLVVSGRIASGGLRQGEITAGNSFAEGRGSAAISALASTANGARRSYAEYPGVLSTIDSEERIGTVASLTWGKASARTGYRKREKAIPTGSYGTDLADPRNETVDENLWFEFGFPIRHSAHLQSAIRVFGDRYRYNGTFAFDSGLPFKLEGVSASAGAEALITFEPLSWYRATTGVEIRRAFQIDYQETAPDGTQSSYSGPFSAVSAFTDHEIQLRRGLTLTGGARIDARQRFPAAFSPRLAIVVQPRDATTLKLLYGEAFRAPSPIEAEITSGVYLANPDLRPEQIRSLEIELRERMGNGVSIEASVYQYHLTDLIDTEIVDGFFNRSENVDRVGAHGAELQADVKIARPISGRFGYAYQVGEDARTGGTLTNAPAHVATAELVGRHAAGLSSSVRLRHESGRGTLAGTSTRSFTRTDGQISYAPGGNGPAIAKRGVRISLGITNVFDSPISHPGGPEHRQASLAQPGRAASLRLDWRF